MQPQDLRICNWITDENDFPMQVVTIGTDYICADFEGNEGDVWEFDFKNNFPKPIKLTEEILLKCGFVSRGIFWFDLYLDEKTKLTLGWHPDGRIDFEISINKIYFDISHIKYLHQLQNLYFCLTGKELKFKTINE